MVRSTLRSWSQLSWPPMRQALCSPTSQMRNWITEPWHTFTKIIQLVLQASQDPGGLASKAILFTFSLHEFWSIFFPQREVNVLVTGILLMALKLFLRQLCILKRVSVVKKSMEEVSFRSMALGRFRMTQTRSALGQKSSLDAPAPAPGLTLSPTFPHWLFTIVLWAPHNPHFADKEAKARQAKPLPN